MIITIITTYNVGALAMSIESSMTKDQLILTELLDRRRMPQEDLTIRVLIIGSSQHM